MVICRHVTSHECTVFDLITNLGPGSRTEAVRHLELFGYIEDITRRFEDMNFIFEWLKQYFTNEYCFHHEKIKFISSNRRVMFCLLYSCKLFKTQVSNINFRPIMLKTWLYFNIISTKTIPVHHFSVFLYYFHFFSAQTCSFFL